MFDSGTFQKLIDADQPTGEVAGVNRFLVKLTGLEGVAVGALILFENGERGMVREVGAETVTALNLDGEGMPLGTLAVLESNTLSVGVGEALIGRVVSALGQPIDDKGPINLSAAWPVFNAAPGIIQRQLLVDQLPSGVTMVDILFPVVQGQRIAVLGDGKSGKSTFLTQLTLNQTGSERIVVYVMIGKRKLDIDTLIARLEESGAIKHTIVVVASIFDSLAQSYLAPYTACAMAEHLWYAGRDVVIIYDDLSSHAKVYREVSLLSRVNPGRDSYPGDMFYAHSSLLERAGKLAPGGATLTALPVVITPGDDITAYLPTSIMSITDGQLIFDLESFRQGIKPAVNAGLSVSRVGGRAQNVRQKALSQQLFKLLADFRQASEFAHFGSDLAVESQRSLELGKRIYELFKQPSADLYSLTEQLLMLEVVTSASPQVKLDVTALKQQARSMAPRLQNEAQMPAAIAELMAGTTVETAK